MSTGSGYSQNVVMIGTMGLEERQRTSPKGVTTNRYTVSVKADPIVHTFDAYELGRKPAEAIAKVITAAIKSIGQFAAPATQLFRQRAANEMAGIRGPRSQPIGPTVKGGRVRSGGISSWVQDRYSGGRTGTKQPNQTKRLFNDSGRLAEGIYVQGTGRVENPGPHGGTGNEWTINVPANRLDPSTFRSMGLFQAMTDKLLTLVPELRSIDALGKHPEVVQAISDGVVDVLIKRGQAAIEKSQALRREYASTVLALFRGVGVPL